MRFINLVWLIVLGVAISYWFISRTESFSEIANILALGGGFTWIAVVFKLLPDSRKTDLQKGVQQFIEWGGTTFLLLALTVCLLFVASCLCTIDVKLVQDALDRLVLIYPASEPAKEDEARRLSPGDELRKPMWTGPFGSKDYLVKVQGYPAKSVRVGAWGIESLKIPFSFRASTILLRSSPHLASRLKNNPSELIVARSNGTSGTDRVSAYAGEAVWIGCDEAVEIPAAIQQRWRDTLPETYRVLMDQWLPPKAVPFSSPLKEHEKVTFSIPNLVKAISITVQSPQPPNYFPQEILLDDATAPN